MLMLYCSLFKVPMALCLKKQCSYFNSNYFISKKMLTIPRACWKMAQTGLLGARRPPTFIRVKRGVCEAQQSTRSERGSCL